MPKFKIEYGFTGGYNDITTEEGEFDSQQEADDYAYEMAVDKYESSSIATVQGITLDDFLESGEAEDEEEAEEMAIEAMENWIHYVATKI